MMTSASRKFSIFFILFCVIGFATALNNFWDSINDLRQSKLQQLLRDNIDQAALSASSSSHGLPSTTDDEIPLRQLNPPRKKNILSEVLDTMILHVGASATTARQLTSNAPLLGKHRDRSTTARSLLSASISVDSNDTTTSSSSAADMMNNTHREMEVSTATLLHAWKSMSEERFVLDMLLRLETIDKEKHIDPWVQVGHTCSIHVHSSVYYLIIVSS
jgi:hypothetical protein